MAQEGADEGKLVGVGNSREAKKIYVYRTTSPAARGSDVWDEVLHVTCTNNARSFELLDNPFYFGLGHDRDEAVAHSGALLMLSANPEP